MNGESCRCGQPAVRTLCAFAYCQTCAEEILAPIRERVEAREITPEPGIGFGHQAGPLRPDWGEGWAELECDVCHATWVGPLGEECAYCQRWLELANETQRQRLLWPDLPDPDDDRYQPAIETWVKRLAAAIAEQVITASEARAATDRKVPDDAA